MQSKEIFLSIYGFSPKVDPWGTAISAMFDVAGEMYTRGLPIPSKWNYSPGMGDPRAEDEFFQEQLESLSDDVLVELSEFLARLCGALDRAGKSY